MAQSSSSFNYDVFLSFRGIDTRYGFTGNLEKALRDKGIHSFFDDRELHKGYKMTESLFKAIENSRIAIPVFSVNFASSSFCLDELVHIVDFFMPTDRLILPVFCGVEPSQLRHQKESYGKEIAKYEKKFKNDKDNMKRLQNWKRALKQAASLAGYHYKPGNEYEYNFIGKIVSDVINLICRVPLHVVEYPVGLQSRVLKVKSLLDMRYDSCVHMIGIHGIGGMGKSTLAREIYNSIADQFECVCFLHNIRENSAKHGLQHLQEELLSKTVGFDVKLRDVTEGIPIIKQRLRQKNVLLILDDVDNRKQIKVLAGGPDWFGHGSRVIITTRDIHLLESHKVERKYEVDALNVKEALELLRWNAVKDDIVDSSFEDLLNRGVGYASGLPLVLEVVGSNLSGKKDIEEWKSTLDQYERIPHKEIQNILKVSFDALAEEEKSVFLDIACCFKGYEPQELEKILLSHYGQCMKYHIRVLAGKSLIKIIGYITYNQVILHDLIEVMGKEIVRQESPLDPGKRSRLWFHEDIVHVLEENTGTSQIKIIHMNSPFSQEEKVVEWKGDELKEMKNLATLIIKNGRFSKGVEHLPNNLRVLEWHRYPSCGMPLDFCGKKLSICKLQESELTSFGLHSSLKMFMNLKELKLGLCQYLIHIPDLSTLQNLETLSLYNCPNLLTMHPSVGFLHKLKILNASICINLESFPPMKLPCLEKLDLVGCRNLKNFPEILVEMKNITTIYLTTNSIENLSISFENLTGLKKFTIYGSGRLRLPINILIMQSLSKINVSSCLLLPNENLSSMVSSNASELVLSNCHISDKLLSIILMQFPIMRYLDLSRSNFTIIPECIEECRFLKRLDVNDCKFLREIRKIPPNLNYLSALRTQSLTSWSKNMVLNQEHEAGKFRFTVPSTKVKIPKWFEHQNRSGTSFSFWFRNNGPSVALFIATKYMRKNCPNIDVSFSVNLFINGYKYTLYLFKIPSDHAAQFDLQLQERLWRYNQDLEDVIDLQLPDCIPELTREEYQERKTNLDEALLKNKWIHVEIMCESMEETVRIKSGIHVFKPKIIFEDNIRFDNPYKLDELLSNCLDRLSSLNFYLLFIVFYFLSLFWSIPNIFFFL